MKYLPARLAASVVAAIILAAASFIEPFEGRRLPVYLDPVGIPTVCVGHTAPDLRLGQVFTDAQCTELLQGRIAREFLPAVQRCVKVPVTADQIVALVSFGYNVGTEAMCRSTLVQKLNARDCIGASAEFDKWVRAGGRILPGLVKRRDAEERIFVEGCYAGT